MVNEKIIEKIRPGVTVKVVEDIKEGGKTRASNFRGIVIARKHGKEAGATFTVRSIIAGEGVEKVYPIHSPRINKVEIVGEPKRKVRRSKLYYLRNLSPKQIRQKLGTKTK
ncbi:MAG: 50S ribosomal protein L19 [Patescibacteria group bacterium]